MMKKAILFAVSLVVLTGCKTTEENYRRSYETTIAYAQEKEKDELDNTTYNKILETQKIKTVEVNGEQVPLTTGYAVIFNGESTNLKRYNIVVGAMKQQFNAKAFCNRLKTEAKCNSFILTDKNHNYFIIADAFNDLAEASNYLFNIGNTIKFKLPIDQPYVYQNMSVPSNK